MLISAVRVPKKAMSMDLSSDVVSWVVCRWRAAQSHGDQWKKPPQGSQDDALWCLTSRLDLIMHLRIRYRGSCPSPLYRNPYIRVHGRLFHYEHLCACSMVLESRFMTTTCDWRTSVTFEETYRCGSVPCCEHLCTRIKVWFPSSMEQRAISCRPLRLPIRLASGHGTITMMDRPRLLLTSSCLGLL